MLTAERQLRETCSTLRRRLRAKPALALIGGSGQGRLSELLGLSGAIPMREIPHLHQPTVQGQRGEIYQGRLGAAQVLLFAGRCHYYENQPGGKETYAVRVCARLGIRRLILFNSAGGINPAFQPGDLMLISDVLNLLHRHPLLPMAAAGAGRGMVELSAPLEREWLRRALAAACELKLLLHHGVYAAMLGPAYETRAEIQMLERIGADAVGMSTLPEILAARRAGMKTLAISCITNSCARPAENVTHAEVLHYAGQANQRLAALLLRLLREPL